jgi:hypothetical protein
MTGVEITMKGIVVDLHPADASTELGGERGRRDRSQWTYAPPT